MAIPPDPSPANPPGIDPALVRTIRQASQSSSTDFGLLMAQAKQESSFRPDAKAAAGSAAGLFQFIDTTWLDMVHRFGGKYGVADLADKIKTDDGGKPTVADPATRKQILALRNDPALSASLAGEYAKLNKDEVERALGHAVGRADIYMAHFLGAGGATQFLKALETKGSTVAADLLPDAAASNRSVFYDGDTGRAKTVAEIYRALGGRIEQDARDFGGTAGVVATVADATPARPQPGDAPQGVGRNFAGLQLSPAVAGMLDSLTLAALKLVSGAAPVLSNGRRTSTQS
jgi:hypothetical protein